MAVKKYRMAVNNNNYSFNIKTKTKSKGSCINNRLKMKKIEANIMKSPFYKILKLFSLFVVSKYSE